MGYLELRMPSANQLLRMCLRIHLLPFLDSPWKARMIVVGTPTVGVATLTTHLKSQMCSSASCGGAAAVVHLACFALAWPWRYKVESKLNQRE